MAQQPPRRRSGARALGTQAILLLVVLGCGAWLVHNVQVNLQRQGLAAGYDFLGTAAGFDISEGPVPFDGTDTYLRAFLAGAMNTLRAALPALALASFVGFASGIAAISRHPLVRAASIAYVDAVRNVPLLVQLLLWYFLLTTVLPAADEPLQWGSVYLSNAGLTLPALTEEGWVAPERTVFGVSGGAALTSEWLTLVLGLVFYAGAYMSELVRAGLQSVQSGQWEAAQALSLSRWQTLRRVIVPQSLRVIVPPYVNLAANTTKNSSLAIAVGYPDVVSVATTSMNQTGRAIECISLIAAVYLTINLIASLLLNLYNRRVAIRER